jgi:hypothetical protein
MGGTSSLRLLAAFGLLLVIATTAPERIGVMPRQWLIERLTVAEAEARRTRQPDDLAEPPELMKPFGTMNKEWESLKRRMQRGDELWTYEKRPWPGYGGIALVRNRVVVDEIWTWIH